MPPRPPPAPPTTPAARQREVARMLVRLDDHLKKASELSSIARERVSVGGLARYRRFTKRVRDFFALAALVEERIDLLPEELGAAQMATALDRMHARMVLLFIEGSAVFFGAFAKVEELPIGTHEMCGLELRGLLAIRGFLDDPRYDGERGQALRVKADRIAELMRMVMDRVPPLPDFGDLPSISPKGGYSKPIKPSKRPAAPPPPPPPRVERPPQPPEVRELSLDDFKD
ncbi:hypothetical protein [Azospirillum sp.]|uniref:hypothetical protein n=1 Tax=Azospirillum sp. TaxID=34012 RepID=UPI003D759E5F